MKPREFVETLIIETPEPERIGFDSLVEDMDWVCTDKCGHTHRWSNNGDEYEVETAQIVTESKIVERPCECCGKMEDEEEVTSRLVCKKCGETIAPEYKSEWVEVYVQPQGYRRGYAVIKDTLTRNGLDFLKPFDLSELAEGLEGEAMFTSTSIAQSCGETNTECEFMITGCK